MPAAFDTDALTRRFDLLNERLRAIEAQLALVSDKVGVPYTPPAEGAPPDVLELARAGKQLEAIKRYRELTGAGFDDARDVVLGL